MGLTSGDHAQAARRCVRCPAARESRRGPHNGLSTAVDSVSSGRPAHSLPMYYYSGAIALLALAELEPTGDGAPRERKETLPLPFSTVRERRSLVWSITSNAHARFQTGLSPLTCGVCTWTDRIERRARPLQRQLPAVIYRTVTCARREPWQDRCPPRSHAKGRPSHGCRQPSLDRPPNIDMTQRLTVSVRAKRR